jgi:hypothetical protein
MLPFFLPRFFKGGNILVALLILLWIASTIDWPLVEGAPAMAAVTYPTTTKTRYEGTHK